MKFKVLKQSHLKRNILIGIMMVAIISTILLNFTRAKYRVTESIPLISGTINYKPYDFKMIAMYQENENGEYENIDIIPTSGYILNTEKSYCKIGNEREDTVSMEYKDGKVYIGINKKGTKCTLYFDELNAPTMQEIISNYNIGNRGSFDNPFIQSTTKTVFTTTDWTGTTYYFAGNPTDNWVYFGGFYWRIIRINGDGSIRMIYNGSESTGPVTTGEQTQIGTSSFNNNYNRSEYVGFKYTLGEQHGIETDSAILTTLNNWYLTNKLVNYENYIENNVGFCNDRNVASGNS